MSVSTPKEAALGATVGLKILVAVTGVILFGFVVGHLAGNLQVFAGPEKINAYSRFLHQTPALTWSVRLVLLAAVILHIAATVWLALRQRAARPLGYAGQRYLAATYSSRTMIWSGPIIAAYVVYHLLHLTFGTAHPAFRPDDVYQNLINGFLDWRVSLAYVVAIGLLAVHLRHGLWSMFQTVGLNGPRLDAGLRGLAAAVSGAIAFGYIVIPVAVLMGWVH